MADVVSIIRSFSRLSVKHKIFLIDNSPYAANAYENYSNTEYIHTGTNLGYGKGHNIALRKSLAEGFDFHFILNPDVSFETEVIRIIADYMHHHKDVGLLMPKILYPAGNTQYLCKLLPTPFDLFTRRFLPGSFTKRRTKKFELRETGYNKIMEVPFLSGCFMSLRREAVEQCGMFDERFFMYGEDIDFSRRIHKKFRTIFYPFVSVTHIYEAASYKNTKMLLIHLQNIIKYFNKWGWFLDKERKDINKRTLRILH